MAIYDLDPETGLLRDMPEPPSDALVTEQRRIETEARYAAADYLIKNDQELAGKGHPLTP